jgi:chromosome partitioning protein
MQIKQPLDANIGFEDLLNLASKANEVIQDVRNTMLAPTSEKSPPVFSAVELAALCGVDKPKILYTDKKGILPPGVNNGTRLEWTLDDAITWVKHFRSDSLRNPQVAAGVVIAVANFKGGVAKTTTTAALAQGLSLKGHRVLAIDLDPQGSLTTLFGLDPNTNVEEDQTILPMCIGGDTSIMPSVRPTYWKGVDLVAAAPLLYNAEFVLPHRQKTEEGFEFWRVLDLALEDAKQHYDVILIDTSPALSYLTINAIMASNGIVMPLPPSALDFASSAQFWSLFTDVCGGIFKQTGNTKKFHFLDILLSRVDKADAVSVGVRQWISSAYGSYVLPVEIPKTSIAATASATFGTVYDIPKSSVDAKTLKRARDAYDLLVEHVEIQIGSVWEGDKRLISLQGLIK